jgi:ubiquinol-cytochrome c reductase iron-sulfur subunit
VTVEHQHITEPTGGSAGAVGHRPNTRAYRAAVVSFVAAPLGGLVAAWGYWSGSTERLLGIGLAICLGGIGFGLVSWAKYLDFDEEVVQQRAPLRTTEAERDDLGEEVAMTVRTVGRRRLLVVLFGGSLASLVIAFVGPIGSLGPRPRGERARTGWAAGRRLVTTGGAPVPISSEQLDQLATVFPEGYIGVDDSQVILLRVDPGLLSESTAAGSVEGWVAYSKICTHAGCSVGLLGMDNRPPEVVRELVCPCHQSVFDPLDGARPIGGPAPRSLPQLPLAVDADGFLVAAEPFSGPVGPIAWDEA